MLRNFLYRLSIPIIYLYFFPLMKRQRYRKLEKKTKEKKNKIFIEQLNNNQKT